MEAETHAGETDDALVLIVEDDRELARALEMIVRAGGMRTERAADGPRALELWRAAAPDLVLLDLGLPGMDGTEVLRTLRDDSRVPVVILTGMRDEATQDNARAVGADAVVHKPLEGKDFRATVGRLLSGEPDAD